MLFMDGILARLKRLRRILDYLTSPPTALTDPHERRQVRAMAVLLLSMGVLTVVFGADWLLAPNVSPVAPVIIFSALGMFAGLFVANRRGRYRLAAWVFVVFTILASYILVIDRPTDALALTYQLIAVLTVSVFMPVKTTALVSLAVIVGTLLLPVVFTLPLTRDQYAPNAQAIVALVAVIMLSTWHHDQLNGLRRKEVAQSEKRYRIISELLSDFACAFDARYPDPPLEWTTDSVFASTGYTPAELSHVSDWDRMALREDLPKLYDQRRSMYAKQPQKTVAFRVRHKNGAIVWLTCSLHPEWENDRVVTVYVAFSDITERMRLQEEMSETRNKFMSIMSHEFRTPLTVILSTTEILDKYHERLNDERRHELLERVIGQVTQLATTMEGLSLLVQMQSGKLQIHFEPTNLGALMRRWVDSIRASVGANHHFDFSLEGDLSAIWADERLLTIVVSNLLSNAVKYSPPGTTISVQARRDGDFVQLEFADQGIGIPEADLQKLYQPYFRASNVGTVAGTGLGLRTVKECVELHDGGMAIESTVGTGTRVSVILPAIKRDG